MGASEIERRTNEPNEGGEMTNEQVMKLMEELGLHDGGVDNWYSDNAWVKSARLVAEHEREACAKICGKIADSVNYELSKPVMKCYEAIRARGLTSLQRQLIDAETLQSDPAGLKARGQV